MILLRLISWPYFRKHILRTVLTIAGIVLGVAVFVDAGNAADRVRDLRAAYGIGAGARLRTPLGPFRVDLAYGELHQNWRLHFSIGLSF